MRLEHLAFPYCEDFEVGYVVTNKENRRVLVLKRKTDKKLCSTQYARYLLACKLGRYLKENETVDHIDNDKTNDSLENLTVLSRKENISKCAKCRTLEHGKSSMIKSGCKCEICRAAKKELNLRYLNKHRSEVNKKRREKRHRQQ